jgi:hypothetical protein
METSLQNFLQVDYPWKHWIVDSFLTSECLNELKSINSQTEQTFLGKRNGSSRLFVTENNKTTYPHLYKLYQSLHTGYYKDFFEFATGNNFDNLYPRLEIISDYGEFELVEHTDHLEKKLSVMVYTNYEILYPGTTLSNNYVIEAKDNRAFFFVPSDETLHSYPKINFKKIRRCLMINYWTYDV